MAETEAGVAPFRERANQFKPAYLGCFALWIVGAVLLITGAKKGGNESGEMWAGLAIVILAALTFFHFIQRASWRDRFSSHAFLFTIACLVPGEQS